MVDTMRRAAPDVQHPFEIIGKTILPGERRDLRLKISEMYTATPVYIPLTIVHGARPGARLLVTAAVHGNELNGVEMIRQIRADVDPALLHGTLILVLIANPIAFMMQSRDLPDGRDLNRVFPGTEKGSMAAQIASDLFEKVVLRADYGIDLHTAAQGRTNLPHVRADLKLPSVRRIAHAFGCEVVFDMAGEKGMLRHAATRAGVPMIVYEAGEPLKFQKALIRQGVAGIKNVMADLGLYAYPRTSPPFQFVVEDHRWVRSERGGIFILNVKPGDIVRKGEPIGVSTKPFGTEAVELNAPYTGLVVGTSTLPMVIPGSAVCHLVKMGKRHSALRKLLRRQRVLFE
jgi:uncharacterized protein